MSAAGAWIIGTDRQPHDGHLLRPEYAELLDCLHDAVPGQDRAVRRDDDVAIQPVVADALDDVLDLILGVLTVVPRVRV